MSFEMDVATAAAAERELLVENNTNDSYLIIEILCRLVDKGFYQRKVKMPRLCRTCGQPMEETGRSYRTVPPQEGETHPRGYIEIISFECSHEGTAHAVSFGETTTQTETEGA